MHREILIACSPYVAGIAVSVLILRLLIAAGGGRLQLAQLRHLHADQRGAVQSLSFVLTLPLLVMVLLFIVQLSQLTIGRIVVEYAAYAAARSAVVWIPANLGDDFEEENQISMLFSEGEIVDEQGMAYRRYGVLPGSRKFERIRLAAAFALLSICPSRDGASSTVHPASASLERAYFALAPSATRNPRVPARLRNKLGYALENTLLQIEIRHKHDDRQLPLARWEVPPDQDQYRPNEIGWQDQIMVTVTHDFALLPGPGRLLARPRSGPQQSGTDVVADRIRRRGNVFVYPMTATARLNNEGEKSQLPYIQAP